MGDKISYTIHLTLGLEALLFKSFNLTSLTWTTHPQQESLILKNCECYSVLKKVSSTGVLRNNSFEKILRALVLESFGIIAPFWAPTLLIKIITMTVFTGHLV